MIHKFVQFAMMEFRNIWHKMVNVNAMSMGIMVIIMDPVKCVLSCNVKVAILHHSFVPTAIN